MSALKETARDNHIEDTEKDLYSVQSGSTYSAQKYTHTCPVVPLILRVAPPVGIDAEVAQFFAQNASKPVVIDEATNVRLRWMVHKRVLAVMVITYFAQTLDKGTLNFASIMGIITDTHLQGQQYAWLTTCGNARPVLNLFPNRLIQRLPVGKYLGVCISAWGLVLALTAACKNFAGLVVVRTLLGVLETVCQPAFVFLSTMWYTRAEQALVIGAFYSMNGFQQCVGGLIGYGISQIEHAALKNWQVLFTLLGCLTFVWGLFVLWWLPDSPMRATCWSPEDRLLIAERVRKNETGIQNREFKVSRARSVMMHDPTVWLIVLVSFTNALPTGGLGAFSNLILVAFGFTRLQTYLLAIAQGTIIMLFLFTAAYLSKIYNQKLLLAFIYTLPNVAGTIVFICVKTTSHTKVGLLLAFYCMQGFGAVAVLNLAVMSNNVAGRTKQVIASSLVFIAWALGNAIGPQVFRADDAPRYIRAFIAHMVLYGIQLVAIVVLRLRLMRLNVLKRRAQALEPTKANGELEDEKLDHKQAFDDLTDFENKDCK
ncbi:MFS general substrate transporter [Mycena sp. CBHHK59/15]|nr:MFS general substrate transporter [Mycena sp. CBHHK59/15]